MKISIPVTAGDGSLEVVCTFTTDINLTGATGEFNLSNLSQGNIINKSATITTVEGVNTITGLITKTESADLKGSYFYDFTITDAAGNVVTVRDKGLPGKIEFTQNLKGA